MPQSQQQQQQEQPQMAEPQDEASSISGDGLTTALLLPGVKLRGPQPPPVNPLKFIKVSPPVNMYKAPPVREAPPPVEIKKEEAEDWQNDLEGWKFNRRKRQEHLMERVTEIKKLEEEHSNSSSRRNKTFNEMMKSRKSSIVVYDDANENDFSDLGLGGQTPTNNNDDEVFESSESEITYEKAIQGYVDFASSRANKPSMATGSASQINDTNITTKISRKQNLDNDSSEVYLQETIIHCSPHQNRNNAQKSEDFTFINKSSKATIIPESGEPKSPIKEKNSLLEKISIFERTSENFSSSKSHSLSFEIIEDSSFIQSKKLGPPVPAKPKAALREEFPILVKEMSEVTLAATKEDSVNIDCILTDNSSKHFELRDYVEERSSEILRPATECQELDQSLALSDDSSNVEADTTEVCTASLKLNNSLEHAPPRDIQRSPLGGEDSGVHTADSVSQSDEVEEDEELASQLEDGMSGLLGILTSQVPIIDTELSALLAPPLRLEPPREKPPPPPPICPEPDTETMRKNFLGLEVITSQPTQQMTVCESSSVPSSDVNSSESDCLGTQLKERLLKLEEEKNNIINMEKHLKVEQVGSQFL